jgi:hypothetical protein
MAISIPRPSLPAAPEAERPGRPGERAGRAPVAGYHDIQRARCVALGGLTAMVAAVVTIFATTVGSSAPKPAPVAARPVAAKPRYWVVRSGQTLSSIAAREGVTLVEVERLNPQLVPNNLISGQRVRLP